MIAELYYTDTMTMVHARHIVSPYVIDELLPEWTRFQQRINMEMSLSLLHEGKNHADAHGWARYAVMVLSPPVWPEVRPGRQLEVKAQGCVVEVVPDLPIQRMENSPSSVLLRPRVVQTAHGVSGLAIVQEDRILLWSLPTPSPLPA